MNAEKNAMDGNGEMCNTPTAKSLPPVLLDLADP